MTSRLALAWLSHLSRRFLLAAFAFMAISLIVLLVLIKLWALDFQASSYARLAGGTMARYDMSQGDKRLMVEVAPDHESDTNGPPFVHGILLRFVGFNPANLTNTSGLTDQFIGQVVYSDYDRLLIDQYNRAKQRAIRARVLDSPVSGGRDGSRLDSDTTNTEPQRGTNLAPHGGSR
ncbi:MAG: hypothetical protein ACYDC1_07680 [Limisphaerales bacterium]